MTSTYTYRQSGTTGQEIIGPEGVIAWTVDAKWAGIVTGLLNGAAQHIAPPGNTMANQEIKDLIRTLLTRRPDLVIVMTDSPDEKRTLVETLKNAGAKIIYQDKP